MKKLIFILVLAILLGGGAVTAMSAPSYAQGYNYPPPPQDIYATPWVGPNTPWVYYNGDWFLNGILYYFFGPRYGWAPYYSYAPTYIVRPRTWYAPMWLAWYRGNPHYYENFQQTYPYWREHRQGHRYDQRFFEQHQHGQVGEWHKGFRGHPEGQRPGPAQVAPPAGPRPGPGHVAPPAGPGPTGPAHVAPPAGPKPGPAHVAPPAGPRPGPAQVAPPAGPRPGPAQVAPPAGPKPGPAPAPKAAPAPQPEKAAPGAPQPEKGGHGEEKR